MQPRPEGLNRQRGVLPGPGADEHGIEGEVWRRVHRRGLGKGWDVTVLDRCLGEHVRIQVAQRNERDRQIMERG